MDVRRVTPIAVLVAIVAAGAFLRFDGLGVPSLWLDEILGYDLTTAAFSRPLWSWVVGFDAEHGSLYYATQLIGRLASSLEVETRLLPAVFGTVTVVLVWWAQRAAGAWSAAGLSAAAILAVSPLHVYYSREGRPYALAMLLAALLLVSLLRESSRMFLFALGAALLTSAVAAPLIASAAVAAFSSALLRRHDRAKRRLDWIGGTAALLVLSLVPLLYRGAGGATTGVDFPNVDAGLIDSIVRALSVTAVGSPEHGRAAWAILLVAFVGAVALTRRDRRRGTIVVVMTVLPIVLSLLALWISRHWFAIRYVCVALPAFVVLVGSGIAAIANLGRVGIVRWAILVAAVAGIATQTIRPAVDEPYRKLDWRVIASTIWRHAHNGDLVMTAEGWSTVSLGFYLRQLPQKVRSVEVTDPVIAHALLAEKGRAWLVTAGHSIDTRVRGWFCQFPVVLSSRQEDLRVHYAPSASDFLALRSLVNERRAFTDALGGRSITLHLGPEDAALLREGWAQAEGAGEEAFRWAVDGSARMVAPFVTKRDRVLSVRVTPLEHPSLPPQVMDILMNCVGVARIVLEGGTEDHAVTLPAERWSTSVNLIEFRFTRANAPAELDRGQRDPRRLSASFDTIAIAEEDASPVVAKPHGTIRLQELTRDGVAPPLDQQSLWRGRATRLEAQRLSAPAVRRLVARLGFDPEVVWPRIAGGEVAIESLMESLATSSGCHTDQEFVRRIWTTVFERPPNAIEERVLLTLLRQGPSRVALIDRVVRMDEFRRAISGVLQVRTPGPVV